MRPRIVFDVDDTICKDGKKLGYEKATPMQETIDKINYLHKELDAEIILYTARGMGSCEGDILKARMKNEATLIKWLETHNVHYDELIFGKPLADLYVDDKGMSLKDFLEKEFSELKGGSGSKLYRLGDIVVKQMKSIEEAEAVKEWAGSTHLRHPHIYGNVYENLYMEYIDGQLACECLDSIILDDILQDIEWEKSRSGKGFSTWKLLNALDAHKGKNAKIDSLIDECKTRISAMDGFLENKYSPCHGDMILSNIIIKDWRRYYIDPRPDAEASSYLLDYAKLKMSIDGYERIFGIGTGTDLRPFWKTRLEMLLKAEKILKEVTVLELMYILRLTNYRTDYDKIIRFAEGVIKEID